MIGNRSNIGREDYYTRIHVLKEIADLVDTLVPRSARRYFDFSAGDGQFANLLLERSFTIAGQVDLFPRCCDVLQQDFLQTSPRDDVDIIGLNPPFGKQGVLAKQFVRQAEVWQASYIVLILPARLRGTFWIHEYDVLHSQPISRNAFFRPSRPNVSIHVPTTLWILQRRIGSVAKLATFVRPNLQTPTGVKMFPRTKT